MRSAEWALVVGHCANRAKAKVTTGQLGVLVTLKTHLAFLVVVHDTPTRCTTIATDLTTAKVDLTALAVPIARPLIAGAALATLGTTCKHVVTALRACPIAWAHGSSNVCWPCSPTPVALGTPCKAERCTVGAVPVAWFALAHL